MKNPRYSEEATFLRRQKNYAKWVAMARKRHGTNSFCYEGADKEFVTQLVPQVSIYCMRHKLQFGVRPYDHLRYKGGGCPNCEFTMRSVGKQTTKKAKFLKWFNENASTRLALVGPFRGMTAHIQVQCLRHKCIETVKPTYLMVNGAKGCRHCASEAVSFGRRISEDSIRAELAESLPRHIRILGLTFDKDERVTRICIKCERHGEKLVSAAYLRKSAYKCPGCGDAQVGQGANRLRRLLETGDEGRLTWIVVAEIEVNGISSLKVGVTSRQIEQRYLWCLRKVFFKAKMKEVDALILENKIHRSFDYWRDRRILLAGMRGGKRWSGDTECYWLKGRVEIERFIKRFINELSMKKPDYWDEFERCEFPQWGTVDVSREKDLSNRPRAVVCIETGVRYPSIAKAGREAGINSGNISMVLARRRRLAGGYRWAYAEEAAQLSQEPLRPRRMKTKPVRCVETDEVFQSVSDAARTKNISNSHICSVCKGYRRTAGGLHWRYVNEL